MLSGTGIGVEGGHMIENDMKKLDSLQKRGALEIIACAILRKCACDKLQTSQKGNSSRKISRLMHKEEKAQLD
jgi:hypothetical protein